MLIVAPTLYADSVFKLDTFYATLYADSLWSDCWFRPW